MPSGRGCPPGRDFEEDECRQLKKVPSLKFRQVWRYKGWLPKCFLWNGKLVFYNTGGIEPPTRGKNVHKAICKTKRTTIFHQPPFLQDRCGKHQRMTSSTTTNWKTSKNDFSDRECPNINGGKTIHVSLQGCKGVCMEKQGCTGFNYNHKTRSCVMRGCSLPVKPPARNHYDDEYAFWLALTTTGSCKYGMSSIKTSVSY